MVSLLYQAYAPSHAYFLKKDPLVFSKMHEIIHLLRSRTDKIIWRTTQHEVYSTEKINNPVPLTKLHINKMQNYDLMIVPNENITYNAKTNRLDIYDQLYQPSFFKKKKLYHSLLLDKTYGAPSLLHGKHPLMIISYKRQLHFLFD